MGLFSFTDLSTHVNRKYGDLAGRKQCTITSRFDCSIPSLGGRFCTWKSINLVSEWNFQFWFTVATYATPNDIERRRNRNVIFLQALLSNMISCNGIARTWGCHHPRAHSAAAGRLPVPTPSATRPPAQSPRPCICLVLAGSNPLPITDETCGVWTWGHHKVRWISCVPMYYILT